MNIGSSLEGSCEDSSGPTIPCLLCDSCDMPICSMSDIIFDRASVMDSSVYSYELDLLGEDIWVYSATNPSTRRFDVVRVSSSVVNMKTVKCEKGFSMEHTWFPPYAWCMCECSSCGRHLGWGFRLDEQRKRHREDGAVPLLAGESHNEGGATEAADARREEPDLTGEEDDNSAVAFVGLIVTYCKPAEEYSLHKYHELVDGAVEREARQQRFKATIRDLFRVLQRIPDQLAANRLAMQLMHMPFIGRQEVADELLVAGRALLGTSQGQGNDDSDDEEASDEDNEIDDYDDSNSAAGSSEGSDWIEAEADDRGPTNVFHTAEEVLHAQARAAQSRGAVVMNNAVALVGDGIAQVVTDAPD